LEKSRLGSLRIHKRRSAFAPKAPATRSGSKKEVAFDFVGAVAIAFLLVRSMMIHLSGRKEITHHQGHLSSDRPGEIYGAGALAKELLGQ